MALAELQRRRPRRADRPVRRPATSLRRVLPLRAARRAHARAASWLYSEATVGLCLSLTNFSLMPKEMLACGLPCVELAGVSAESIFGSDGPMELAPLDPNRIADAMERLLGEPDASGSAAHARGSSSSPPTPGSARPTKSKRACATRCASANGRRAAVR